MRNEILQAIVELKEYDNDPKLNNLKMRLEKAVNRELLESLNSIAMVGDQLGYNGISELFKNVYYELDRLETGSTLKNKANMNGERPE